jgi:signal peptidase I
MTHQDTTGRVPPDPSLRRHDDRGGSGRRIRRATRIAFWTLVGLATAVLITSLAIPVLSTRGFTDSAPTMEPAISPGQHLLVAVGGAIRRGDIVVLHVPATATGPDSMYVQRVIGLPGDHVACCNAQGHVTVNGRPLNETYLYPGDRPSEVTFSARLHQGQIWVMGDRRNISLDSRTWGPVRESGVVGRVILVMHGSSFTPVRTPQAFVSAGLAPPDTRLDFYVRLGLAAAASVAALVILVIAGVTSFLVRQRRSRRAFGRLPEPGS